MGSCRGSELLPQAAQGSGRTTLFASSDSFFDKTYRLAAIHRPTLQTDDRRTQHRVISVAYGRLKVTSRLRIAKKMRPR